MSACVRTYVHVQGHARATTATRCNTLDDFSKQCKFRKQPGQTNELCHRLWASDYAGLRLALPKDFFMFFGPLTYRFLLSVRRHCFSLEWSFFTLIFSILL